MAAHGAMYDKIVAAIGICANKSTLATISANPINRGTKVFNWWRPGQLADDQEGDARVDCDQARDGEAS